MCSLIERREGRMKNTDDTEVHPAYRGIVTID